MVQPYVAAYIEQAAKKRGIDPRVAVEIAHREGGNFDPEHASHDKGGDGGSSFGVYQLHYGGVNPSMPHGGMGDDFTKATGLDARDPSTWRSQVDFALDRAKAGGWGPWYSRKQGDKPVIGIWDGIKDPAGDYGTAIASGGGSHARTMAALGLDGDGSRGTSSRSSGLQITSDQDVVKALAKLAQSTVVHPGQVETRKLIGEILGIPAQALIPNAQPPQQTAMAQAAEQAPMSGGFDTAQAEAPAPDQQPAPVPDVPLDQAQAQTIDKPTTGFV